MRKDQADIAEVGTGGEVEPGVTEMKTFDVLFGSDVDESNQERLHQTSGGMI